MKAIWDNSRGLDVLASLSFVDDAQGFGAIGHSLGGHNAIYTAVFDTLNRLSGHLALAARSGRYVGGSSGVPFCAPEEVVSWETAGGVGVDAVKFFLADSG